MLELFSGTRVVSEQFRRRGWRVVSVDLAGDPSLMCDVRELVGGAFDFIWASPPCEEFTRSGLPWHPKFGSRPSLDLVEAAIGVWRRSGRPLWCLENVRASVRWIRPLLGDPEMCGSCAIWHNLSWRIGCNPPPHKQHLSSSRRRERATIPGRLAAAVCERVCEHFELLPSLDLAVAGG